MQEIYNWCFWVGMIVGMVYIGIVGGYECCQYVCVGNCVNLVVCLMMNVEWGEFFVDEEIKKIISFWFFYIGNIKYKGIKGSVFIFKLLGCNFDVKFIYIGCLIVWDMELW